MSRQPIKGTIIENVSCQFGDDHTVTIHVDEARNFYRAECTCDEDHDAMLGMSLLNEGEDKHLLNTCWGFKTMFNQHVIGGGGRSEYDMPRVYRDSMAFFVGSKMAANIANIKAERQRAHEEEAARKKLEAENDLVTKRLNMILQSKGDYAGVMVQKVDGQYWLGTYQKSYSYTARRDVLESFYKWAVRKNGVWFVRKDWKDHKEIYNTVSSWGGHCRICGGDGYRDHRLSKKHVYNTEKALFLAAQATSRDGIKLQQNDPDLVFKYRRNQKHIVGVQLADFTSEVFDVL